jgi:hypothetical protein
MIGENPARRVASRSGASRIWLAVVYTGGTCARGASKLGKQRSNRADATVCDGRDVDTTRDWLTVWGSQAPGHRSGVFANVDGPVGCERESCGGVLEESLCAVVDGGTSDDRAGMVGERDVVRVGASDRLTSEDGIALTEDLVEVGMHQRGDRRVGYDVLLQAMVVGVMRAARRAWRSQLIAVGKSLTPANSR